MKILAIWERPKANPKWGGTFCLVETGELLYLTQGREYTGTDAQGDRVYAETGTPEWSPAFHAADRFDFWEADRWLRHFGGRLCWQGVTP